MPEGVTLITPTGGREKAFALCQQYMENQKHPHIPVQWIIVDDCVPQTPLSTLLEESSITLVHPEPPWEVGKSTQARNLLAALPHVKYDKVLVVEDDDWYAPNYVEEMVGMLKRFNIVGCESSRYYNVPAYSYLPLSCKGRSSLCSTGFQACLLPLFQKVCESVTYNFIDIRFWQTCDSQRCSKGFIPRPLVTGMKGLPGRPGIGGGHRRFQVSEEGWKPDTALSVLKEWVGEDWVNYKEFL